jgi:undecaprenyl-diphosphatase
MKNPSNLTRKAVLLDRTLFRAVFGVKWKPLDAVMRWLTLAGTAGALWGAIAFAAFVSTGFGLWNLALPWAAISASWLVAEGSKYLFNRGRPFVWDTQIAPLIKTPSSSSFPSGHSATAAAGAISLAFLYPAFALPLMLAGFLVVLSRVYLGVHYPFDVFAGMVIGTVAATVGILVFP